MKRALLMSSSRMGQFGYLEHAEQQLHTLFQHDAEEVLFPPSLSASMASKASSKRPLSATATA